MGTQSNTIFRAGLLAFTLTLFAACSSTSDTDEAPEPMETEPPPAVTSGADNNPGPSAEELARQEALAQTVFYFDFDIAEFKAEDRETLTHHAQDLAENSGSRIRLEGHADERGTREYNLALGERRANGILNYLIVNGASRGQIEVVSYGEEQPEQTGQSESAYAMNRRVEIVAQ